LEENSRSASRSDWCSWNPSEGFDIRPVLHADSVRRPPVELVRCPGAGVDDIDNRDLPSMPAIRALVPTFQPSHSSSGAATRLVCCRTGVAPQTIISTLIPNMRIEPTTKTASNPKKNNTI